MRNHDLSKGRAVSRWGTEGASGWVRVGRSMKALGLLFGLLALAQSIWPVPRSDRRNEEDSGPPFPLDALFALFQLVAELAKWVRGVLSRKRKAS